MKKKTYTQKEVDALLAGQAAKTQANVVLPKPSKVKRQSKPKAYRPEHARRMARMNAIRPVTVVLTMSHNINGKIYGPGEVTVSNSVASDMLHTEHHARRMEAQFHGEKAAIIGPRRTGGHVITEVAPATFDNEYASASPAFIVDRNNPNKE